MCELRGEGLGWQDRLPASALQKRCWHTTVVWSEQQLLLFSLRTHNDT
jgi:hypothetical protein